MPIFTDSNFFVKDLNTWNTLFHGKSGIEVYPICLGLLLQGFCCTNCFLFLFFCGLLKLTPSIWHQCLGHLFISTLS